MCEALYLTLGPYFELLVVVQAMEEELGTEESATMECSSDPLLSSSPSENEEQYGAEEKRRRKHNRKNFFEGQA